MFTKKYRSFLSIALSLPFTALTSYAKPSSKENIKLNLDLHMHGKYLSSPKVITEIGKTSFVTKKQRNGRETLMELKTEKRAQGIYIKFVISEIIGGKPNVIATPEVIALNKKTTEVTLSDENQEELVKLKVTPELINSESL